MAGVEVLLNLPGEFAGNLPHNLGEQVVAAALYQAVWEQGDHPRELDPNTQIQVPPDEGERFGVSRGCAGLLELERGVELHVVEALEAGFASRDGHGDDAIDPLALGE